MDFPPMETRAFPGKREEAYRAGITPRMLSGTLDSSKFAAGAARGARAPGAWRQLHALASGGRMAVSPRVEFRDPLLGRFRLPAGCQLRQRSVRPESPESRFAPAQALA